MPIGVRATATAGEVHPNPFVGPVDHTVAIRVDVSALSNTLLDAYGYLKQGAPLARTGIPVGAAPAFVFGCVAESVKVAASNVAGDIAAGTDQDVTVVVIGAVNRAILEDSLGRALTADEIAGFIAAGSKMVLLY